MKPKRYLVFGCHTYYPAGGWGDLRTSTDTLEQAKTYIAHDDNYYDDMHIIDLETGEQCQ